ncbi:cytochrome P450, partial [Anaerolinea sp.]|uniref:cytochrome P450 n=1 Tax=Anaerolinea sp. TaxID=1872519 RepID=UPI002ACE1CDD
RRLTAKFFSPATVRQRYIPLMERTAESILAEFQQKRRADLNEMAGMMATSVVAEVVGLTESPLPVMAKRLDRILHANLDIGLDLRRLPAYLNVQGLILSFYLRDVRPAIRARRAQPREDLISHLIAQGRRDREILVECITYGAAGMVTTQEFLCVAAYHFLRHPEMKEAFLQGDSERRRAMLEEILRLEPVVGHLYRRAEQDLEIPSEGQTVIIPAGALIDLHIMEINRDARALGEEPLAYNPERQTERGVSISGMSFGFGPHRCAGEHLALTESEVFLSRFLALPGVRIEREPALGRNETIEGYELRRFIVAL